MEPRAALHFTSRAFYFLRQRLAKLPNLASEFRCFCLSLPTAGITDVSIAPPDIPVFYFVIIHILGDNSDAGVRHWQGVEPGLSAVWIRRRWPGSLFLGLWPPSLFPGTASSAWDGAGVCVFAGGAVTPPALPREDAHALAPRRPDCARARNALAPPIAGDVGCARSISGSDAAAPGVQR